MLIKNVPFAHSAGTWPFLEPGESSPHHPYFSFKIHLDIIVSHRSSRWFLSLGPPQNTLCISPPYVRYTPSPLMLLDLIALLCGKEYKWWASHYTIFSSLLLVPLLKPKVFLSTLFSNAFGLCKKKRYICPCVHHEGTQGEQRNRSFSNSGARLMWLISRPRPLYPR
jgi:hypothetical protein